MVNSFHEQAIDRLAPSLRLEARASDGTIEAVSGRRASFLVGVQWHPESPERRQTKKSRAKRARALWDETYPGIPQKSLRARQGRMCFESEWKIRQRLLG